MPINKAKENGFNVVPPNINKANKTIKTVTEVLTDRVNVWFKLLLIASPKLAVLSLERFSLILSKTTTVS